MRILVLGGTVFLGRHVVEAALERGDEVTLFNRGLTAPGLHPEVEHLRGDRDGDLEALAGGEWDAVIDTCGYVPRVVRRSAELLSGRVGRYVFVSSVSVYADFSEPGLTEDAPVATVDDGTSEDVEQHYGALKALCEEMVSEVYGDRALLVRPGLIVGPHDPTGRFTYWPVRMARGGRVLAPAPPSRPTQFVDVRDLAAWMIRLTGSAGSGTLNATGEPVSFGELLRTCAEAADAAAEVVWVEDDALVAAGVEPWTELPLWLPGDEYAGLEQVDVRKARTAGLTSRPLAETVRDTLAWAQSLDGAPARQQDGRYRVATLTAEREAEILASRAG